MNNADFLADRAAFSGEVEVLVLHPRVPRSGVDRKASTDGGIRSMNTLMAM